MYGHCRGRRGNWFWIAFALTMAIAMYALGAGSAQAAMIGGSAGSDKLAGFTSQGYPVFFKVSSDGRTLVTGGIAISMTCTSGATVVVPDRFVRVPIHANGRLHATYTSPTIVQNGTQYRGADVLTAVLAPKQAQLSGMWRLAVNYSFASGMSDQCDSGPVGFTATP